VAEPDPAGSWLLTVKGGEQIVVPASLKNLSTYTFLELEDWFELEADFVRSLAGPGFRALDIGANLGYYTIVMARRAGPDGHVWAFEPNDGVARCLRASVRHNHLDNVDIHVTALGTTSGSAALDVQSSPEFNVVRPHQTASPGAATVTVTRLDDLAPVAAIRGVDFVKLDVEGMEADVLRGGARFFTDESPLIMTETRHGGQAHPELLSLLQAFGYRLWRLVPALQRLAPLAGDATDLSSLNVFACRPDRAARLTASDSLVDPATDRVPDVSGAFAAWFQASGFGHRWTGEIAPLAPWIADPAADAYRRALDQYAASRDPYQAPDLRYVLLRHSYAGLVDCARAAPDNCSRVLSVVRAAADLGLVADLLNWLTPVVAALSRGDMPSLPEPFLPLAARFEAPPAEIDLAAWSLAMALEVHGRFRWGTTYDNPVFCAAIEEIIRLGCGTAELERGRQLYRIASGAQAGPRCTDLLTREPATTLNREFWRGQLNPLQPEARFVRP
jgi:FkbM family methyltransferase